MTSKQAARGGGNRSPATIVIRREEGEEPQHHGGAWKVAYADFVTAMMAFFLLMWLLNATTEEQRIGLADYFAPTNLFGRSVSGSGQPFGGKTPNEAGTSVSTEGSPQTIPGKRTPQPDVEEDMTKTPAQPLVHAAPNDDTAPQQQPNGGTTLLTEKPGQNRQTLVQGGDYAAARLTPADSQEAPAGATSREAAIQSDANRERHALEQAGARLLDAIRRDPTLRDAAGQLTVDSVPEGLRIQVVDSEGRPMFALGSSSPTQRVHELMEKVVPALAGLPNAISIAGHTDSLTYRGQEKSNWELSSERANVTRRILVAAGLADERIRSITGNADRDLRLPAQPFSPANRRITIIVLRHAVSDTPEPVTP